MTRRFRGRDRQAIRCRKCGATIVVQGTGGAGTNGSGDCFSRGPTPPPAFSGDDVQWHVNLGADADPRTMTVRELIDAYNTGVVTQETFIWTDGMDDWKPLSDVEAVVAALHADAAGDAAPPSAYGAEPASAYPEPPAAAPESAFQASAPAAEAPAYEAPYRHRVICDAAAGRGAGRAEARGGEAARARPVREPRCLRRRADERAVRTAHDAGSDRRRRQQADGRAKRELGPLLAGRPDQGLRVTRRVARPRPRQGAWERTRASSISRRSR